MVSYSPEPMKKIKRSTVRNKLDKIVSEIVRARGYCMWCGNKTKSLLQCCHIYSRNNLQTRWYLNNLLCMCAGCHFKSHQNPIEFGELVKKCLSPEDYIELIRRSNTRKVWANYELQEMYNRFKEIQGTKNNTN